MNIFKKKSLEQMLEGAHKTELKKNLKAKADKNWFNFLKYIG